MKTITIPARTIVTYSFTELSPEAQELAISDKVAKNYDDPYLMEFHGQEAVDSLKSFCEKLFPNPRHLDYSIDYSSAARSYVSLPDLPENTEELTGQRLRTWIINNWSYLLRERKPYGAYTKNEQSGKWRYKRRSRIIYVDTCCPLTGVCYDETLIEPIRRFVNSRSNDSTSLTDILKDCTEYLLAEIEADYNYRTSDDYAMEQLESDTWTQFNVDGSVSDEV